MCAASPEDGESPEAIAQKVRSLAQQQHAWRGRCLNLIASENITSAAVREMMITDFEHRYAEGEPYKRYYCGTRFIDEIELLATKLAKRIFHAEHVNVKPLSGFMANLAVFYALTSPGDVIMSLDVPSGGHISYMKFGGAGIRGLRVERLPFNAEEMNVDAEALKESVARLRPKLIMFGGSVILFPPPLEEFVEIVHEYGGYACYDAAHVLGLIAGGQFQDPISEGADVVSCSTHKTLPGPQGGMILSRKTLAEKLDRAVFPGLTANHHLHRLAALAIALAEMEKHGAEYARRVIRNAKALGKALYELGFDVLCAHKGFTETHQIMVDVRKFGGGEVVAKRLEEGNVICNKNLLPWDNPKEASTNPSGIRLGTAEVTRLGMDEGEMATVAGFLKEIVMDKKSPADVAERVARFAQQYSKLKYSLDEDFEPYRFFSLK